MKAHVFVISMLTGIVVTYAVLLLGCLFIDKTLPTVDVVILSLVVGASAQQLSRVLMSINRTFPYLACSQRIYINNISQMRTYSDIVTIKNYFMRGT